MSECTASKEESMHLHEFTVLWWERTLSEDGKLVTWLHRLHQAETDGAKRFQRMIYRWTPIGPPFWILDRIIADELRHKGLVEEVLTVSYGVSGPFPDSYPDQPERFWGAVWQGVDSFETACAAATFGEMLALNRFRVILAHRDTPTALLWMVNQILPDEARHAKDLRQLAGPDAMHRVRPFHRAGMAALGLTDVKDDG